jgi:5-oxopent-3-ene-1,2,5-tricarboxylate decarboxylase/2-hydroxyhepta-2,4-diene-1,7-dioate isomerase
MIAGTVYGVVLNDLAQRAGLAGVFGQKPYGAPPKAPVLYIKPRNCWRFAGADVPVPAELAELEAAATVALLFGDAPGVPVAAALALDVCEPHASYYRPAIRQRCRDGFLPLGEFVGFDLGALLTGEIVTSVDGVDVQAWGLARLVRDIPGLIADVSQFMTLENGDVLLMGLPGDAPRVRAGQTVTVSHGGLPPLSARFEREIGA